GGDADDRAPLGRGCQRVVSSRGDTGTGGNRGWLGRCVRCVLRLSAFARSWGAAGVSEDRGAGAQTGWNADLHDDATDVAGLDCVRVARASLARRAALLARSARAVSQ